MKQDLVKSKEDFGSLLCNLQRGPSAARCPVLLRKEFRCKDGNYNLVNPTNTQKDVTLPENYPLRKIIMDV